MAVHYLNVNVIVQHAPFPGVLNYCRHILKFSFAGDYNKTVYLNVPRGQTYIVY